MDLMSNFNENGSGLDPDISKINENRWGRPINELRYMLATSP